MLRPQATSQFPRELQTMEWAKTQYETQRDNWVPWIEDMYLKYFTNDNKASYSTKGTHSPLEIAPRQGLTRSFREPRPD